jgi:hypothetical protein
VLGNDVPADRELLADGGIGPALRHEPTHLALARDERADDIVVGVPGEQAGDHLGVHGRSTAGDPPFRLDELVAVHYAVLQEVADTTPAVGQQLPGVELLDVLGQHQDGETRHLRPRRYGRLETVVGERRGEPDIDNGEVGRIGGHAGDEIAPLSTAAMIVKTRRSSLPCGCLPPQRRDQGFKWR